MSIIYDALKKVEGTTAALNIPKAEKPAVKKSNHLLIYIFVVVAGLTLANFAFVFFAKKTVNLPVTKNTPALQASPVITPEKALITPAPALAQKDIAVEKPVAKKLGVGEFSLNGIFLSEGDTYALVNNQVVKTGDSVNGATVKDIAVDKVVIVSGDEELTLSTSHQ